MIDMLGYEFIRTALLGTTAIGIVCAYLGVYVVLRRIVFVLARFEADRGHVEIEVRQLLKPLSWSQASPNPADPR